MSNLNGTLAGYQGSVPGLYANLDGGGPSGNGGSGGSTALPSATMWKFSAQSVESGGVSTQLTNYSNFTSEGDEFTVNLAAGTITPSTGGTYEIIANVNWFLGPSEGGRIRMEVFQIDEADGAIAIPIGIKDEFFEVGDPMYQQQLGVYRFKMDANNLYPFYIKVWQESNAEGGPQLVTNEGAARGFFATSLSISKLS